MEHRPAMKHAPSVLLLVLLVSCSSPFSSHTDKVKFALDKVDYKDGIAKAEAKAIADAYLIRYGSYKGRPSYSRISEAEDVWMGEVFVVKSLASPVNIALPPVIVDKKSGAVSWKYGPTVKKISLDGIDTESERGS